MTRWAMIADLRRCIGCQTCTASCRHANATPPGVQWRRVLDMEFGEYPDVQRAFVPVGCQHCDDPPCMTVCPTKATKQRADGIVTIDYDLCIGCAYCAVACPYQARYKTQRPLFAYGAVDGERGQATGRRPHGRRDQVHVLRRSHRRRPRQRPEARHRSRSDAGVRQRVHHQGDDLRRPRRSAEQRVAAARARPSISGCTRSSAPAPASITCGTEGRTNASMKAKLRTESLASDELGRARGRQFHVRRRRRGADRVHRAVRCARTGADRTRARPASRWWHSAFSASPSKWAGRCVRSTCSSIRGRRGCRARRSPPRCCSPLDWRSWRAARICVWLAAALALVFVYCQARILQAAKGIPAWREPLLVPLIVITGVTEGAGLFLLALPFTGTVAPCR